MHNKDARSRFKVPPQLKDRRSRRRWLAVAAAVAVAATLVYPLTTGAAQQDLTASFSNVPDTHNGSPFTFDLTFDPEPSLSYRTLKDHSFTVVNGEVTRAERYQKRPAKNLRWKIRVVTRQYDADRHHHASGLPPRAAIRGRSARRAT